MGQTRMFRDRVVSMEQTLEGGEKHLPLLQELCREALPEFEYARACPRPRARPLRDGASPARTAAAKTIAWTRMVLFDAERIPTLTGDPAAGLRATDRRLSEGHAGAARDRRDVPPPRGGLGRHARAAPRGRRTAPPARRTQGGRGGERGGPAPGRRPAARRRAPAAGARGGGSPQPPAVPPHRGPPRRAARPPRGRPAAAVRRRRLRRRRGPAAPAPATARRRGRAASAAAGSAAAGGEVADPGGGRVLGPVRRPAERRGHELRALRGPDADPRRRARVRRAPRSPRASRSGKRQVRFRARSSASSPGWASSG